MHTSCVDGSSEVMIKGDLQYCNYKTNTRLAYN